MLEKLAHERHAQSRGVAALYADVESVRAAVQGAADLLQHACFEDATDLENTIREMQVSRRVRSFVLHFIHVSELEPRCHSARVVFLRVARWNWCSSEDGWSGYRVEFRSSPSATRTCA